MASAKKLVGLMDRCAELARQAGEPDTERRCRALADELRGANRVTKAQERECADLAASTVTWMQDHGEFDSFYRRLGIDPTK